ncbi:MAG: 3-isopropylmalate dehydratase small subunit [Paracoccus sp. (in: a-proteobacteria)]|nr:3-isopropylmalate dehydratase small subunit [Paracoccus sp. (in: a-proteobacteria)]
MRAFVRETSSVVVVPGMNCDTDQIIPGRFLKADRARGYGQFLFHDIRRDPGGNLDLAFPLNRPGADKATILLVEDNFGCGSSREGAVYALIDHGIRALIAPSFGDIFHNNALKNGLLPVRLDARLCKRLTQVLADEPGALVTIDLEAGRVDLPGGLGSHPVIIEPFARECILRGVDEIEMTLTFIDRIIEFENARIARNPWLGR